MSNPIVFALALALGLVACSASPPQPAPIAQYERDMARAQEGFHNGRLLAAAASYQRAVAGGERYDDAARLAPALLGLAAVALELDDYAAALSHYRRAAREADRAGLAGARLAAEIGLAETARRSGDCAAAMIAADALATRVVDGEITTRLHLLRTNCMTAAGDPRAALASLSRIATDQPARLRAAVLASEAAAQRDLGNTDAALAAAQAALVLDQNARNPLAIAADHKLLASIADRRGDGEAAREHALRAWRIYRQTGQTRAADRVRQAFPAIKSE